MTDKDMYGSFSKTEMEQYALEAKERWGNTDMYKESTARVAKLSREDLVKIQNEGDELLHKIAAQMDKGPESEGVQRFIGEHYRALRAFYKPSLKLYRGLAELYVADPRFAANYEKRSKGLAQFMHDAMICYCNNMEK